MESGQLVPDELVNDLVAERFRRSDRPAKFVMDGYPRTVSQALAFDAVLKEQRLALTAVVLLAVPDEEIVSRLKGRWNCPEPSCRATYHSERNPPKVAGICDRCGTALVQRPDDNEATVRRRLAVYHQNTAALIPHYRAQGLLVEVSGSGEIEQIYANILLALNKQAGRAC